MPVFCGDSNIEEGEQILIIAQDHVIVNVTEEGNDIFLAGGDALVYLTKPNTKNIQQHLLVMIHLVRTYVMTNFSIPLPLYTI